MDSAKPPKREMADLQSGRRDGGFPQRVGLKVDSAKLPEGEMADLQSGLVAVPCCVSRPAGGGWSQSDGTENGALFLHVERAIIIIF